jgi:manganese/iron transport system substrate-binding protein
MSENLFKSISRKIAVIAAISSLSACQQSPTAPSRGEVDAPAVKPKVLATTTVLCDIAQRLAASTIELHCVIPPGSDPHVYEPTPGDRKQIEQARLILYAGYGFEPNLIKLIRSSANSAPKVAVDEIAVPHPQTFQQNGISEPDPHVWHSAQNGINIVKVLQRSLTQLKPEQATLYAQNAQRMTAELAQLDHWIKAQIATIPQNVRRLVTTHDALGHYSTAYGIPVEGALMGISTEERPSAARIKALVDNIRKARVPTIFVELTASPKLIDVIAQEAQVKVSRQSLYADGLGEPGSSGDTYPKMLIVNTETIVKGLGGKLTPFTAQ